MSRIGITPIPVPANVDVTVAGTHIRASGPKGTLDRDIPALITVRQNGSELVVERPDDERESRAMHGLVRTLVANMVHGVTEEFTRELEIVGVGYRAQLAGRTLDLALGYSHPVRVEPPEGISFEVPMPTRVVVRGIDKQQVGQTAADIRDLRQPEPYKGKGVRYLNEAIIRKAGKAGK